VITVATRTCLMGLLLLASRTALADWGLSPTTPKDALVKKRLRELFNVSTRFPFILNCLLVGRSCEEGSRKLLISYAKSGYVATYSLSNGRMWCKSWPSGLWHASMVVLFALMPNRCYRHSVIIFDFKKRDVSRVSEGDQQFSPAGVLLQ
jgi:hypothetical protein